MSDREVEASVKRQAKRKKDQAYYDIREGLDHLLGLVDSYEQQLETELAAANAEAEPYMHLVRALEQQLGHVKQLASVLDDQVWPAVISVGNGSAYVQHARTRDY